MKQGTDRTPWWQGEEERVTYPLYVHLAIAGALLIGFGIAWLLLPAVSR